MSTHKGKVTILFNRDRGLSIELEDDAASSRIIEIQIGPMEAIAALSRLGHVDCKYVLVNAEKAGKKMEMMTIKAEMPRCGYGEEQNDKGRAAIIAACPEGWEPDLYLNSQGSFTPDGDVVIVRDTARRWVDVQTNDNNEG